MVLFPPTGVMCLLVLTDARQGKGGPLGLLHRLQAVGEQLHDFCNITAANGVAALTS